MGLLDKLFDKGAKALGDIVSDKVSDVLNGDNEIGETFRSAKSAVSSFTDSKVHDTWEEAGSHREKAAKSRVPEKSFEEKLQTILENAGNYELRKTISPDELEQEFGREIYTRGGCYCKPEGITYGIYQGGNRILMIRLWLDYGMYSRKANRQIKDFCDANGVKMLDFFEYLPNEEDYMEQRIRENLV
ncbi:MAG: hypothetical protein ACI4A3_08245 [Lachnospiraceae bacterium]